MAIAGKSGKIMIGVNAVADIQSWSLDIETDMLEDTALGDSWKTSIPGLQGWSASAEGKWVINTDTNGQTALQTAFMTATTVAVKLYTNATNYYSGTAYINSMSVEDAVDDSVSVSFEFTGTGALSYS